MAESAPKYPSARTYSGITTIYVAMIVLLFVLWFCKELLERRCGMYPRVIKTESIKSMKDKGSKEVNFRLTKQFDLDGHYRIQVPGSIHLIKAFWKIFLLFHLLACLIIRTSFYYDHFILWDRSTGDFVGYLFVDSVMAIVYPWELIVNRYAKLSKSSIAHHWLTCLAAVLIIIGDFNPFATWYGIVGVVLAFPENVMLGIRAAYHDKHPNFVRIGFKYMYFYYLCISILNIIGQIFLVINGFFVLHEITIFKLIYVCLAICVWMYDDYQLLKVLKQYSQLEYEKSEIHQFQFQLAKSRSASVNINIEKSVPVENKSQTTIPIDSQK